MVHPFPVHQGDLPGRPAEPQATYLQAGEDEIAEARGDGLVVSQGTVSARLKARCLGDCLTGGPLTPDEQTLALRFLRRNLGRHNKQSR
jgi:hypothetical protein